MIHLTCSSVLYIVLIYLLSCTFCRSSFLDICVAVSECFVSTATTVRDIVKYLRITETLKLVFRI